MNLINYLNDQIEFSEKTFGPGERTEGILDHIRKELKEIEAQPNDLEEWIDLITLAFDGAWRIGYTPEEICAVLAHKLKKNKKRDWPDWRDAEPGKAIEHVRSVMEIGDFCRAECGAPARYIGHSRCLYVSASTNDICEDYAKPWTGGEGNFPHVSDDNIEDWLNKTKYRGG